MGKKLENNFLWSRSRAEAFRHCLRKYYLMVWGGWPGWECNADEQTRLVYRLSKMQNLHTWAGDIIHGAIGGAIQATGRGQADIDLLEQRAHQEATNRLREGWRQSVGELYYENPKYNLCLFEHYYNRPIEPSLTDYIRRKVHDSIDGFFASDFLRDLAGGAYKVVTVEDLLFFEIRDFRICVKLDFAGEIEDEAVEVWDWKSGRRADSDETQARIYGLSAWRHFGYGPGRIENSVSYLRFGSVANYTFTEERLEATEGEIIASCQAMRERMIQPQHNVARAEDFPLTEDRRKCADCQFWEACYGTRKIEVE